MGRGVEGKGVEGKGVERNRWVENREKESERKNREKNPLRVKNKTSVNTLVDFGDSKTKVRIGFLVLAP